MRQTRDKSTSQRNYFIQERQKAEEFGAQRKYSGHVVFVVNTDQFFVSHRISWAMSLIASGAKVTLIAPDTGYSKLVTDAGINFVHLNIGRESISLKHATTASMRLKKQLTRLKPDVVFLVATAAYTLGLPSVLALKKTRFVVTVTGSGRALTQPSLRSISVKFALRKSAQRSNSRTLFQIGADREFFIREGLAVSSRSTVIPGTGIDADQWFSARTEQSPVRILFAARLFREKGVYDFIEIAKQLSSDQREFILAGSSDEGVQSAVSTRELSDWASRDYVKVVGHQSDMRSLLASVDILVAPSTHPEGTPRSLIEASASGVAIAAYDQEGVREVLNGGESGVLVQPGDISELKDVVEDLARNFQKRSTLGMKAHQRAVEEFHIENTLKRLYSFALEE